MNRTCSIALSMIGLIAISLPSRFSSRAQDLPGSEKGSYQEQFLRALQKGSLVNSTPYQYVSESILVPKAHDAEPRLEELSVEKALAYLEQGAEAWNNTAKCVTCHTNGSYMAYRPVLTEALGRPSKKVKEFFERTLREQLATPKEKLLEGLGPTQVVYVASGLA